MWRRAASARSLAGLIHDRDVSSRFSDEKWAPGKSCGDGGGGGGGMDGGVVYVHRKQKVCGLLL